MKITTAAFTIRTLITTCFLSSFVMYSQTQVTKKPLVITSDSLPGSGEVNWINPTNGLDSNKVYTTDTLTPANPRSAYLKATGFGFALSSNSIITGISFQAIGHCSLPTSNTNVTAYTKLIKNGIIQSADSIGSSGDITINRKGSTDTWITFGGCDSLWKNKWTYQDINNSNFGAAYYVIISAGGIGGIGDVTVSIDAVKMTVCYTTTTGIGTLSQSSLSRMIYPNPTSGMIYLSNQDKYQVSVYDECGKKAYQANLEGAQNLDLSFLANGFYNVAVISGNESYNQKLIIRK